MIIVRAPLRISIGGGGTDLPAYYSKYGGEWISAAINKYVYVIINKRFQKFF
jgi:D-glycero-alpha-D-manno-heptose-7-phosphate kinase